MRPRPAPPSGSRLDRLLHGGFEIGVLLKGAFALLETLSGLLLWFIGTGAILDLARRLTLHELSEDPGDRIAGALAGMAAGFSLDTQHFYALYLLGHGLVKLVLMYGLWREARWAFPAAIAAILAFIAYQLYRYSQTGGLGLLILTGFDLLVIGLIWREYRARRRTGLA